MRKHSEPRLGKRLECSELKVINSPARLDELNVYKSARTSGGSLKRNEKLYSLGH